MKSHLPDFTCGLKHLVNRLSVAKYIDSFQPMLFIYLTALLYLFLQKPPHHLIKLLRFLICNKMIPLQKDQLGPLDTAGNQFRVRTLNHILCTGNHQGSCLNLPQILRFHIGIVNHQPQQFRTAAGLGTL